MKPGRGKCFAYCGLVTAVCMASAILGGLAQTAEGAGKESLRGLKGVQVIVEDVDDHVVGFLPTGEAQARVELRLRRAGIPVYEEKERKADRSSPYLFLSITAVSCCTEGTVVGCMMILNVMQAVALMRPAGTTSIVLAQTWDTSEVVAIGARRLEEDQLGEDVDKMVDRFINDWMAMHPVVK